MNDVQGCYVNSLGDGIMTIGDGMPLVRRVGWNEVNEYYSPYIK